MTEPEQPQAPEPEPEGEGLEVHAEPAAAAGGATERPEDSGEETVTEAGDDGLDG